MLIQAANSVNDVRDAERFHVDAVLEGVDDVAGIVHAHSTLSKVVEAAFKNVSQ